MMLCCDERMTELFFAEAEGGIQDLRAMAHDEAAKWLPAFRRIIETQEAWLLRRRAALGEPEAIVERHPVRWLI